MKRTFLVCALAALGAGCRATGGGSVKDDANAEQQEASEAAPSAPAKAKVAAPPPPAKVAAPPPKAPANAPKAKTLAAVSAVGAAGGSAAQVVFPGPKEAPGGTAAAPIGSLVNTPTGSVVSISYTPQRVRGCDGGGWAQLSVVTFFDAGGKQVGGFFSGSGFGGVGMVPAAQPAFVLQATVPAGAVRLHFESRNDGDHHDPDDQGDPANSGPGDNFGPDGFTCTDDSGPGAVGWDLPLR